MSNRLKDLQRQRALAQEQLAWIDREIAQEAGQAPAPAQPAIPPASTAARSATAGDAALLADQILASYQSEAAASPSIVKHGCFLYFALALLLLGLSLVALYFHSVGKR